MDERELFVFVLKKDGRENLNWNNLYSSKIFRLNIFTAYWRLPKFCRLSYNFGNDSGNCVSRPFLAKLNNSQNKHGHFGGCFFSCFFFFKSIDWVSKRVEFFLTRCQIRFIFSGVDGL